MLIYCDQKITHLFSLVPSFGINDFKITFSYLNQLPNSNKLLVLAHNISFSPGLSSCKGLCDCRRDLWKDHYFGIFFAGFNAQHSARICGRDCWYARHSTCFLKESGGRKYICQGILFKFALDTMLGPDVWMYGGASCLDEKGA